MPRALRSWSAVLLAGLAAVVSAGRSADDDEVDPRVVKEASETLTKLAKDMDRMKAADVKKVGDDMARKYSLEQVMWSLKLRSKLGVGVGAVAGAIKPDGIEFKLIDLAKEKLPAGKVAAEGAALIQAARLTGALGRVTLSFTPPPAKPGTPVGSWEKFSKEMQKGSADLEAALKKADPKAIQTAATTLRASCVECHAAYR